VKNIRIAVGYARTSGIVNPKTSIPTQVDTIKKYCEKHSIILKHIFIDECKTGTKVEGRDQYQQLKKLIKNDQVDMVIVAFSDRLARDSYEFILTMNEMVEQGIEFVSVSEGLTSYRMTPLQIVMMGLQVEMENKQRNQRITASAREKFRKGKFIYERKPYGYGVDENNYLIIKEAEAKVVRRIYEEFLNGKGTTQIARELNAEGLYDEEKEKPWSNVKVNNILENKTYTGVIHKKEKDENGEYVFIPVTDHKHPAIVSLEMFDEVQKIRRRKNRKQKKVKNLHLLSGLLYCPNCHSKMYGITERNIYECYNHKINQTGCPHLNKDFVERLVLQYLLEKEEACDNIFSEPSLQDENREYSKIMSEKEQCEIKFARALISKETFERNMEALNIQLKQLEEKKDLLVYISAEETYTTLIKQNNMKELKKRLIKEKVRFTLNKEMKVIQIMDGSSTST
jgi:site-specific DNA recombinase